MTNVKRPVAWFDTFNAHVYFDKAEADKAAAGGNTVLPVMSMDASRPAWDVVAWLHDVVQSDGEQDQALSFSPDSFPLKGVGGFESIKSTPLFLAPQATHNKCDADFVALQIASRFVPYLEPQRRAQLQVAIRDAICKATPPPSVSDDVRELTDADLIEAAAGNGDAFAMVSMLRDDVRGDDFRKHLLAFMNDVRAKFAGVVS